MNWEPAICTHTYRLSPSYTKGKIYLVKEFDSTNYLTYRDDEGSSDNGWAKKFFKLISFKDYIEKL